MKTKMIIRFEWLSEDDGQEREHKATAIIDEDEALASSPDRSAAIERAYQERAEQIVDGFVHMSVMPRLRKALGIDT